MAARSRRCGTGIAELPAVQAHVIGPYVLERPLGRGGMGVVHAARHGELGHRVALKLIPDGEWLDPEVLARFRTEAELLARFRHPAVVKLLDVDLAGLPPYLAMELLEIPTLAGLVAEDGPRPRRLGVRHALRLTA